MYEVLQWYIHILPSTYRSTPLFDEVYGGQDDLTAAFGYEENGETTILFRRKLEGWVFFAPYSLGENLKVRSLFLTGLFRQKLEGRVCFATDSLGDHLKVVSFLHRTL